MAGLRRKGSRLERRRVARAPLGKRPWSAPEQSRHGVGAEADGVSAHDGEALEEGLGQRPGSALWIAERERLGRRRRLANLDLATDGLSDRPHLLAHRQRLVAGEGVLLAVVTIRGEDEGSDG